MLTAWLIAASSGLAAPPGDEAPWDQIRNDEVQIECAEAPGGPWCRSHGVVSAPIDTVAATLENMAAHQDKFDAVASIRVLEPGTMHVTLDYPGLLSDRDYVSKYARDLDGEVRWYRWTPTVHADAPPVDGVVRLERFEGSWRLSPSGTNTIVVYTWQADVGGSFPNWAVGIARRRAGFEALKDLARANDAKLVKP